MIPGEDALIRAFDPAGRVLASGDILGVVKLWDITSGLELRSILAHERALGGADRPGDPDDPQGRAR